MAEYLKIMGTLLASFQRANGITDFMGKEQPR